MDAFGPENLDSSLHRYRWAKPFRPFKLVMTSGDRYQISDPDQIAFGGDTVVIARPATGIQIFRKDQIVAVYVE